MWKAKPRGERCSEICESSERHKRICDSYWAFRDTQNNLRLANESQNPLKWRQKQHALEKGPRLMAIHNEIEFENDICDHLAAHGWLYAEKDASNYDRQLALFPSDVIAWVQQTAPDAWKTLTKNHGAAASERACCRTATEVSIGCISSFRRQQQSRKDDDKTSWLSHGLSAVRHG